MDNEYYKFIRERDLVRRSPNILLPAVTKARGDIVTSIIPSQVSGTNISEVQRETKHTVQQATGKSLFAQHLRIKYPDIFSERSNEQTFSGSRPGEYEADFAQFCKVLFNCADTKDLISKSDALISKYDLHRSGNAVGLKALIAAHDYVFELKFQKRVAEKIAVPGESNASGVRQMASELTDIKSRVNSTPGSPATKVCVFCGNEVGADGVLFKLKGGGFGYAHRECLLKQKQAENRIDAFKTSDNDLLQAMREENISQQPFEKTKPTIIYADNYPAKGYAEKIAKEINSHFSIIYSPINPFMRFELQTASKTHPFLNVNLTHGMRIVLEISFPGSEDDGFSVSTVFGEILNSKKLPDKIMEFVEKRYSLHLLTSGMFGNTYYLQYVYDSPLMDLGTPILSGKSKGPMEVRNLPPPSASAYPGKKEEPLVSIKKPKSGPSIWDRLGGTKTKFMSEGVPLRVYLTRAIVMVAGTFLFYTEITTFGSGQYAEIWTFAFGGIIIGLLSIVAQYAGDKMRKEKEAEQSKKEAQKEGLKENERVKVQNTANPKNDAKTTKIEVKEQRIETPKEENEAIESGRGTQEQVDEYNKKQREEGE